MKMEVYNGNFIRFKIFFFLNKETKVFKNLVNTGQGHMWYAIFVDILTLISPFSNLLARCYHALFACCDCVLLLFW